ncbi:unnamed protein product, partial [Durusdinium trenchii]
MNELKQHLFLQRILFIFEVTKRSAGKAQVLRLSLQQWNSEVDVLCLAGFVIEEMQRFRDPNNLAVFTNETLAIVMSRVIEGDFHEELRPLVEGMDPAWKADMCSMWVEHHPTAKASEEGSQLVDQKLDKMVLESNKLQYEADALSLACDASQLARLFQADQNSERAARIAKICHLRQENQIGSNLAAQFMAKHCHHRAGPVADLHEELFKFTTKLKADNGSLVMWVDYMKLGRLSTQDLNMTCDSIRKGLDWKKGGSLLGDVRQFDPNPPPPEAVDATSFPLKLAHLTVDNNLKGVKKYKVELPNAVRTAHINDAINGPAWRNLVLDFDKKPLGLLSQFCTTAGPTDPTEQAIAPVEEPPPPAFALEPDNIDALIEQYTVENKIP